MDMEPDARAAVRQAVEQFILVAEKRPSSYPLPCHESGVAFWDINLFLIACFGGWSEWQSKKDMSEIIPAIEGLFA